MGLELRTKRGGAKKLDPGSVGISLVESRGDGGELFSDKSTHFPALRVGGLVLLIHHRGEYPQFGSVSAFGVGTQGGRVGRFRRGRERSRGRCGPGRLLNGGK